MTAEEIKKKIAQQQDAASKRTTSVSVPQQTVNTPAAPDLQGEVKDHSEYINEMHRAQQEAAQAELEAAYKKNVAAIDRAGVGVDKSYRDAKNQTAGASEQAKRNFAQYSAANGLNNGARGQAELARSVTLQKALGAMDTQKAQTVADLDLQRTNVETDFNTAIAKAKAEGNYQLAQALYQEKVRVESALSTALQQEYQNAMNKYQLDYQAGRDKVTDQQYAEQLQYQVDRDAINDLINRYQLAYQQEQDKLAQENYLKEFAYQQSQDKLAQENYLKEFAYQQSQDALAQDNYLKSMEYQKQQDALAQENYLKEFAYQQGRDQVSDGQWQKQYDFAKQQYIDQLALEYDKNAGATSWANAGASAGNTGATENTGTFGTGGGKTVAEVAQEVLAGKWGNGAARKTALENAGYSYAEVQGAVDSLLAGGGGAGINDNSFTALLTLTKYQVGNGYEEAAYANVAQNWPQLSEQQRQAVQNMLAQYGLEY